MFFPFYGNPDHETRFFLAQRVPPGWLVQWVWADRTFTADFNNHLRIL